MSSDASSPKPPEVDQAIEQAVGSANHAAELSPKDKKDKKRKRKHREQDRGEGPQVNEPTDGEHEARKKRKKKHRHHERAQVEEDVSAAEVRINGDVSLQDPAGASEPVPGECDELAPAPIVEPERKKKKKKKDNGKQRATEKEDVPHEVMPAAASASAVEDTSSAEFLSAVVAAASATSGTTHSPPLPLPGFQPLPAFPPYHGHYPYPPPLPGYPFPPPPPHVMYGQPPPPPPLMYPGLPPELSLANMSSEDLLRTLQELDISKIASVLKSLGDAAAATNVHLNIPPSYLPAQMSPPLGPPSVRQRPVKSDLILGRTLRQPRGAGQRPPLPPGLATTPPEPGNEGDPEHAYMLANVWMNATKLAEMVKNEGLVYKKGKFSAIEETQLTNAIENYCSAKGISREELTDLIFSRDKGRESFWPEITAAVHLRPIIAVYHHVRRTYHPGSRQGRWMPSEDEALRVAVAEYGQQWTKISSAIGRMDSDCRDRYRNHIQDKDKRQTGHWTKEEESQLTQIVTDMTVQQGKDVDNDIFWSVVSARMGGTRGRQQCRIKWTDSLSTQYKNQGERPRWSQMDAYLLVHKVGSLNVHDDSEIDWKLLPDEHWNSWSAHSLQRRWLTMKRSIKGHEEMSHAEIMDILRTKKAQSPPTPLPLRSRTKKYTSVEAIDDSDDDSALAVTTRLAGSSTGTGTAVNSIAADSDSD